MAKDRLVSAEYQASIDEDEVLKRIAVIDAAFERFRIALVGESQKNHVGLNHAVLTNALYSYWYDIKRLKDFHGSARINKPKKSAYLIKWFLKEKPIWFAPEPFGEDSVLEVLSCINEIFIFRVGLGYANIPLGLVKPEDTESMVYEFAFREHNPGMLSLWFESFMKANNLPVE